MISHKTGKKHKACIKLFVFSSCAFRINCRKVGASTVRTDDLIAHIQHVRDVAGTDAAAEMVKQVKDEFGRIDFLVNNAGITRDNLILRMKEEDWDSVIDTNLKGAWNFSRAALRHMLKNEGGGSVLNISSISGVVGMGGQSNYSASKAGMIGLTKALAILLAGVLAALCVALTGLAIAHHLTVQHGGTISVESTP